MLVLCTRATVHYRSSRLPKSLLAHEVSTGQYYVVSMPGDRYSLVILTGAEFQWANSKLGQEVVVQRVPISQFRTWSRGCGLESSNWPIPNLVKRWWFREFQLANFKLGQEVMVQRVPIGQFQTSVPIGQFQTWSRGGGSDGSGLCTA